jgi:hypothetical protein
MTHDPFQSYAMLGAYSGVPTPLLPFTGQPNWAQYPAGINPLAQQQQLQQLQQLSSILAAQTNPQFQGVSPFNTPVTGGPFQGGQQNPFGGFQQQNPLAALQNPLQNPIFAALQNPMIAASLQNPTIHPLVAQAIGAQLGWQHQSPYQQGGFGVTPFGQTGSPYGQTGYPLAPQTWVGQTGHTGQIHPLYQQLLARALTTPGINPWAGF